MVECYLSSKVFGTLTVTITFCTLRILWILLSRWRRCTQNGKHHL